MTSKIILSTAAGIAIGIILMLIFHQNSKIRKPLAFRKIVRDTIVVEKKAEPIVIEKVKTKIIRKRDTIIKTRPFIAELDTIVRKDTVYARFEFPENLMSIDIRQHPDSVLTEKIFVEQVIERPWWEAPLIVIGGGLLGFLLGIASSQNCH